MIIIFFSVGLMKYRLIENNIMIVNGKIKITKKVGLTITTYGNDRLPTGYLFLIKSLIFYM